MDQLQAPSSPALSAVDGGAIAALTHPTATNTVVDPVASNLNIEPLAATAASAAAIAATVESSLAAREDQCTGVAAHEHPLATIASMSDDDDISPTSNVELDRDMTRSVPSPRETSHGADPSQDAVSQVDSTLDLPVQAAPLETPVQPPTADSLAHTSHTPPPSALTSQSASDGTSARLQRPRSRSVSSLPSAPSIMPRYSAATMEDRVLLSDVRLRDPAQRAPKDCPNRARQPNLPQGASPGRVQRLVGQIERRDANGLTPNFTARGAASSSTLTTDGAQSSAMGLMGQAGPAVPAADPPSPPVAGSQHVTHDPDGRETPSVLTRASVDGFQSFQEGPQQQPSGVVAADETDAIMRPETEADSLLGAGMATEGAASSSNTVRSEGSSMDGPSSLARQVVPAFGANWNALSPQDSTESNTEHLEAALTQLRLSGVPQYAQDMDGMTMSPSTSRRSPDHQHNGSQAHFRGANPDPDGELVVSGQETVPGDTHEFNHDPNGELVYATAAPAEDDRRGRRALFSGLEGEAEMAANESQVSDLGEGRTALVPTAESQIGFSGNAILDVSPTSLIRTIQQTLGQPWRTEPGATPEPTATLRPSAAHVGQVSQAEIVARGPRGATGQAWFTQGPNGDGVYIGTGARFHHGHANGNEQYVAQGAHLHHGHVNGNEHYVAAGAQIHRGHVNGNEHYVAAGAQIHHGHANGNEQYVAQGAQLHHGHANGNEHYVAAGAQIRHGHANGNEQYAAAGAQLHHGHANGNEQYVAQGAQLRYGHANDDEHYVAEMQLADLLPVFREGSPNVRSHFSDDSGSAGSGSSPVSTLNGMTSPSDAVITLRAGPGALPRTTTAESNGRVPQTISPGQGLPLPPPVVPTAQPGSSPGSFAWSLDADVFTGGSTTHANAFTRALNGPPRPTYTAAFHTGPHHAGSDAMESSQLTASQSVGSASTQSEESAAEIIHVPQGSSGSQPMEEQPIESEDSAVGDSAE